MLPSVRAWLLVSALVRERRSVGPARSDRLWTGCRLCPGAGGSQRFFVRQHVFPSALADPGLRLGATINLGERITSVALAGDRMDDAIRHSVERQFPELTGGYHLPRFGRVVAVPYAPAAPGLCDDFRPRFGVDVEVLLPDGKPDPNLPILTGLPLPAPMGG